MLKFISRFNRPRRPSILSSLMIYCFYFHLFIPVFLFNSWLFSHVFLLLFFFYLFLCLPLLLFLALLSFLLLSSCFSLSLSFYFSSFLSFSLSLFSLLSFSFQSRLSFFPSTPSDIFFLLILEISQHIIRRMDQEIFEGRQRNCTR